MELQPTMETESNAETLSLLLDFGMTTAAARLFIDVEPAVVRREIIRAKAVGAGPGALVARWRQSHPAVVSKATELALG